MTDLHIIGLMRKGVAIGRRFTRDQMRMSEVDQRSARVASVVAAVLDRPVLTSPASAVAKLKGIIAAP